MLADRERDTSHQVHFVHIKIHPTLYIQKSLRRFLLDINFYLNLPRQVGQHCPGRGGNGELHGV